VEVEGLSLECAKCKSFVCETGRADVVPDNCPMRTGVPEFQQLYPSPHAKHFAHQSALVEALGYCHWTRLREIAEFAGRMGYERVGIAHCADMAREARLAAKYFRECSMETTLPSDGLECHPGGQADLFASDETQLNVIAGMCVGHEAVFVRSSNAPVTSLLARDARFHHNPAAALYTADGYAQAELYDQGRSCVTADFRGWDIETLDEVAQKLLPDRDGRWCRIRETIEFACELGARHIGVSFCVGLSREAQVLTRVLERNGFRVSSVCCKTGAVPKEELGIEEHEKVRPNRPEMICNPLAQAELLNRSKVELVLILGQCVGHDSATMSHVDAPAVSIVAKDRVLAHNTVAALYQFERTAVDH
jgi:uncharacterized metal-binding protein